MSWLSDIVQKAGSWIEGRLYGTRPDPAEIYRLMGGFSPEEEVEKARQMMQPLMKEAIKENLAYLTALGTQYSPYMQAIAEKQATEPYLKSLAEYGMQLRAKARELMARAHQYAEAEKQRRAKGIAALLGAVATLPFTGGALITRLLTAAAVGKLLSGQDISPEAVYFSLSGEMPQFRIPTRLKSTAQSIYERLMPRRVYE